MIGKLKGVVDIVGSGNIIIDVGGVGYNVFCSANTLRQLPDKGIPATVYIETHVREDHIHLYGFATTEEKESFNCLIKVNGVGAKMALAVLSYMTPGQLSTAIMSQDKSAFIPVSGVGPKLAARIITELKDKVDFIPSSSSGGAEILPQGDIDNVQDAISALVGLGYSRSDSYNVINKIAANSNNLQIDFLIKQGLKELSQLC